MKDCEKEIREEWFKDHVATLRKLEGGEGPPVFHLLWAKPGTNIYRIHYMMLGGCLVVTGDVGDAIYRWNMQPVFLKDPFGWLAMCGMHYFQEKCQASEVGREYKDWFAERAERELHDLAEGGLGMLTEEEVEAKLKGDPTEYRQSAYEHIQDAEDWGEWLKDRGEDVFGSDDWFRMFDIGMDIAIRCRSHLIGIKMAVEQLKARETT